MQKAMGVGVAVIAFVGPCWAGSARNDFDPDAEFARYKTFTIVGGRTLDHSGWLDEPEMHERFRNFVSGALETRGFVEVPAGESASLAVRFWVARRQKEDVSVIDWRTILKQKIEDRSKAYIEAKKNLYKAMASLPPSVSEKDKMRRERARLASKYR